MITFSANTKAKSADVNQNFTDLSTGAGDATNNSLNTTRKIAMAGFVSSGLVYPTSVSLVATLASGVAVVNGKYLAIAAVAITVAASKDTYIYLKDDGTISYTGSLSVTNGAASPTPPTNSDGTNQLLIAKAISSGSAITSVVQYGLDSLGNYIYNTSPNAAPITVYVNAGTAGGTFYYRNQNGIKELWGRTGTIATSTTTASQRLNLPAGFFHQLVAVNLTATLMTSIAQQYASLGGTDNSTYADIYAFTTTSTGTTSVDVYIKGF